MKIDRRQRGTGNKVSHSLERIRPLEDPDIDIVLLSMTIPIIVVQLSWIRAPGLTSVAITASLIPKTQCHTLKFRTGARVFHSFILS